MGTNRNDLEIDRCPVLPSSRPQLHGRLPFALAAQPLSFGLRPLFCRPFSPEF